MAPLASRQLDVLPDGTVQQRSALTGTVVWTVPGRGNRPIPRALPAPRPVPEEGRDALCAFCPARYLETPPEKARLLLGSPDGGSHHPEWRILRDLPAERLFETAADFRRIPNLFEILPLEYWRTNHGYVVPTELERRAADYVATEPGRAHVLAVERARLLADGATPEQAEASEAELLGRSIGLFAGGHDVIVARRHLVDGAVRDDQLCSSGDLTPDEHEAFVAFTVDALHRLAFGNPFVRYVSVYQNWLRPAGASFDHLHKQLVAIDQLGPLMERIEQMLAVDPELFNTELADPAARDRLVIAQNGHAIALAGVGHRYPTIEIVATGGANRPWEFDADAVHGMSALLHACQAATGRLIPANEEWHYRPPDSSRAMPWRILLKWRVSTLAGFEGGTKINVNTISPFALRDRVVAALIALRASGRIADLAIGEECSHRLGVLSYTGA